MATKKKSIKLEITNGPGRDSLLLRSLEYGDKVTFSLKLSNGEVEKIGWFILGLKRPMLHGGKNTHWAIMGTSGGDRTISELEFDDSVGNVFFKGVYSTEKRKGSITLSLNPGVTDFGLIF